MGGEPVDLPRAQEELDVFGLAQPAGGDDQSI